MIALGKHARAAFCWIASAAMVAAQNPAPAPAVSTNVPLSPQGLGIVQAVQITIDRNPLLLIQERQVDYDRGTLMVQQSIFDTNVGSSMLQSRNYSPLQVTQKQNAKLAGINTDDLIANTTTTDVNGSQLFRNGISVTPSVQLTRSTDNLTNTTGLNTSSVSVQVTLPLLRGRGRAAVAAQEIAAGMEVDAAGYDVSQEASQLIANTAAAYWNYRAAVDSVKIYAESEQRGAELLEAVQTMAAADVIPRAEIDNAVANLASRAASRVAAQQNVVQAQQTLALAMGIGPEQIPRIPSPTDPYPDAGNPQPVPDTPDAISGYIRLALTRRADYLAAKQRTDEYGSLLVGARNQLKPQLNGVVNMGYAGLQEATRFDKYFGSVFQNLAGPTISGGLQYQFPLQNRAARGQEMQVEATLHQAQLRIDDVARNIASNVVTAAVSLNSSALTLIEARKASSSFLSALEGEREKMRLGVGSFLDILQTEDRYINAALNEIAARANYASAVANFRLATGTYLRPDQPVQAVDRSAFYMPLAQ